MKTSTLYAAASLLAGGALAHPYGKAKHWNVNVHNGVAEAVVTKLVATTTVAPEVIVWVNNDGVPVATSTMGTTTPATHAAAAPPPPASVSAASAPAAPVQPSSSAAPVSNPAPVAAPAAPASSAASSAPAAPASSSAPATSPSSNGNSNTGSMLAASVPNGLGGYGLSYNPYDANGGCKSQSEVDSDVANMKGYSLVRIYGTDCNQTAMLLSAIAGTPMQLMAGVSDITQVSNAIGDIISAANGDWSRIHTVAVGNELVNSGTASVGQVLSALGSARSQLGGAGYTGHIVTVDTFNTVQANPSLCQNSDFAAVNAHAFFDADVDASGAGTWLQNTIQAVGQACNKNVVVTESGWPTQGDTNGNAVPSQQNQASALGSIRSLLSNNVVMFSAYNDLWKQNNPATFNAEQYWGILN